MSQRKMTITGLHDITVTVKLATRCGSRLICENHGLTCDQCLRSEIQKKLGDDKGLPHFSLQRIYLYSKPVVWLPKPESEISVLFTTPRPGEICGPYFRLGRRGRLVTRDQAEQLIGREELEKKIMRAHESASNIGDKK